ncbi:Ldh family oxidoreductase [Bordetella genomosp. 9]|uniref:Ldh family oxidoreductase n=1 Tax=Bordetella genomosp. 9 TaxID=1416803 RepID=UPI00211AFFFD|nr:Ldh family oxidoreductase [Bordetella genomosp. 9]
MVSEQTAGFRASARSVREQIVLVLTAWGMQRDLADTAAALMAETDLLGIDSHGISMLPSYEDKVRAGTLAIDARPRVVRDGVASALLDGMGGLGYPVAAQAMHLAVDKALSHGVGAVAVRNSHHFGAAGVYARIAVRRGVVGLVTSSANGIIMVPTGGAMPMLGTNPIAFAAPAAQNEPFVLDMATTTVAANKVKVYDFHGKALPPGWAIDGRGEPVTDAAQAMAYIFTHPDGGLTPLGGTPAMSSHKGYGLAMMAQILGSTLSGSGFAALHARRRGPRDPDNIGHFFLALNPDAFRDAGSFEADLDDMIDAMHDTPPARPDVPVLVAGEPEAQARIHREAHGIPIPAALDTRLRDICQRCNARYVLEPLAQG